VLWVLLFVAIAVGGLGVLALVALRLWRSATALLAELDVMVGRAGELADLLAQVQVGEAADPVPAASRVGSEHAADDGWRGTVETYDDRGATAPGKKDP
jgi:hypothetical protein